MPGRHESADRDLGRLLMEYRARIYGYIRSLVVHRADAEDLLQETASVLWRKFDEFQPGSNFLAWALQVARYEVLKFRQRQKRDVLRFSEEFLEAVAVETVKESSWLADQQELLDQCLDKLPPADRHLIELRYHSDVPVKNLAAQLGRPSSTIYDALQRIRRTLVQCAERASNRDERNVATAVGEPPPPTMGIDQEHSS
jgi:RNA polymerase sigma-70 factor, ECF subfamily